MLVPFCFRGAVLHLLLVVLPFTLVDAQTSMPRSRVFDYAVGDTFHYLNSYSRSMMAISLQVVIVGRKDLPAEDRVVYQRQWERYTPSRTSSGAFITVFDRWTDTLNIDRLSDTVALRYQCPAVVNPSFFNFCTDSIYMSYGSRRTLARRYDYFHAISGEEHYAFGLGLTYESESGEDPGRYYYFELVYFNKGGERWGQKLSLFNPKTSLDACALTADGDPVQSILCARQYLEGSVELTTLSGSRLNQFIVDVRGSWLGPFDMGLKARPLRLKADTIFELAPDSALIKATVLPAAFTQKYATTAVCRRPGGYFFLATLRSGGTDTVQCVMTDAAFSVRSALPVEGRIAGTIVSLDDGGCLAVNPLHVPLWPQGTHGPSTASRIRADNTLRDRFTLRAYVAPQAEIVPSFCMTGDHFSIPHFIDFGHAGAATHQSFVTDVTLGESPIFTREYHDGFASTSPLPGEIFTYLRRRLSDGNFIELQRLYRPASPQYNVLEADLFSLREVKPDSTLLWQEDVDRNLLKDVKLYDLFRIGPRNVLLLGIKNGQLRSYRHRCSPPVTGDCPDNLLANAGFEKGDARSWETSGPIPGEQLPALHNPYSGNYAFLVEDRAIWQRLPTKQGNTYVLRALAKSEYDRQNARLRVLMIGHDTIVEEKTLYVNSLDYKEYVTEITVPKGVGSIEIRASADNGAVMILDDLCLSPKRTVSTDAAVARSGLRLFPNPTSQLLDLDMSSLREKVRSLRVYNALGVAVLSKTWSGMPQSIETLDVSHLAPGQYIVRLYLENGRGWYGKMAIVR